MDERYPNNERVNILKRYSFPPSICHLHYQQFCYQLFGMGYSYRALMRLVSSWEVSHGLN
jgi:hypothetical protein